MIQISNNIEIVRPVLQVFTYVATVENNPHWMPVQSVQRLSAGALKPGFRYKQQFRLLGAEYEMDCVVTAFEPHKKISFEYDAPVFRWRGHYLFDDTPKGTRLSAKGDITLGGPLKMAETMFAPKIRKLINDTAPKLKQILES
ncbi:MAG: SRPBCC family protein [Chloroflexi bacterium]|nr:SRPBCC family protein [Chloroflexota bacterium]